MADLTPSIIFLLRFYNTRHRTVSVQNFTETKITIQRERSLISNSCLG